MIFYSLTIIRNGGDDGGWHWLVRMEWRPAGWSVYLPLLILPCTIKSRSSLLAPVVMCNVVVTIIRKQVSK